jgi:hypothetical protein
LRFRLNYRRLFNYGWRSLNWLLNCLCLDWCDGLWLWCILFLEFFLDHEFGRLRNNVG